jgi:aquaporin Z
LPLSRRACAELFGTFWLVFGGCGSAVLAALFLTKDSVQLGIGFVGVALAFGLTVLTMAFAIGHISGCHLNPAVTIGLVVGKRFPAKDALAYIVAQVLGAFLAGGMLYLIASGKSDFAGVGQFASNGYGPYSPGHFGLVAAFACEVVCTFFFLMIIQGATDERAPAGFAPIAIGLGLTLIHLISIPVTNTSVNPARSMGVVFFTGNSELISQLWLFWTAPIIGAVLAGLVYPRIAFAREAKCSGNTS